MQENISSDPAAFCRDANLSLTLPVCVYAGQQTKLVCVAMYCIAI